MLGLRVVTWASGNKSWEYQIDLLVGQAEQTKVKLKLHAFRCRASEPGFWLQGFRCVSCPCNRFKTEPGSIAVQSRASLVFWGSMFLTPEKESTAHEHATAKVVTFLVSI